MKASPMEVFAVITWKNLPRERGDMSAMGTWATCGHDDDACPRITAEVAIRDASCYDLWGQNEGWDGELHLLDPIRCTCAR